MRVGLALGHARVAQLGQQQADVGGRARRAGEDQLGRGCQPHGPHQPGLGMQLERVADLVGQHAGHLVGRTGLLHQAARHDDLAAGRGEGVDEAPVDHHHAHRRGVVRRRRREALGEAVERDAAGRAFALLHVAGELGDDAAAHGLARLLRQHAGDGLRRVQLEEPHGGDDRGHDRDGRDARPQTEQALARRRQAARSAPTVRWLNAGLATNRVCEPLGFRLSTTSGASAVSGTLLRKLAVGPDQRGAALAGRRGSPGPLRRSRARTAIAAAVWPSLSLPS